MKSSQQAYSKKATKASNKLSKSVKKNHHLAAYTGIFSLIGAFVFFGAPSSDAPAPMRINPSLYNQNSAAVVDEISSIDVAATIAKNTNLLVADNVQNLADSLNVQVDFAAADESTVEKPQIVATDAKTKEDVITYTVRRGDTVPTIAKNFGVSADTIRWANGLLGDFATVGAELEIPPISGVIHTVSENDTAKSLAQKYNANVDEIIAFNDAEIQGLQLGDDIIIPDGRIAPIPTYVAVAPAGVTTSQFSFGTEPLYGGNGYSYGYCTWHAANRRIAIGKPIPRNLGNAVSWLSLAIAAGYETGPEPRAGAVLWHNNTSIAGGYGHVAFVEKVNEDGSILVSDMNYGAWNVVTTRTIPPAEFNQYSFIY